MVDKIQLEWLLFTFFKRDEFRGWRGIAEKLITTGSCITTKQGGDIWTGGIGNFISSKPYLGGVDLIELTFNLKEFASKNNAYFLDCYNYKLKQDKRELEEIQIKIDSIKNLIV